MVSTEEPRSELPRIEHGFDDRLDAARIMVVDDVASNVELMGELLQSAGFGQVIGVTNPSQVIPVFIEQRPDLVLLDLRMPQVDGFELLSRLRHLAAHDFVPIVVVTGDMSSAARERALSAGATDYLTKPVDRLDLILRCSNKLETRMLYKRLAGDHAALRAELRRRIVLDRKADFEIQNVEERVRRVLDGRDDLTIVYQPIVDLATGATVGFEALARFPDAAERTPDTWFADADRVGLGEALELLAVGRALAALESLPDQCDLAVNVSPLVACSDALADLISTVDGERVVIELTEHAPYIDTDRLAGRLDRLRASGARIAVDDAGAGYSGLHRLVVLQPDIVKLDRSISQLLPTDQVARILLASLVRFCEETASRVLVEGVEDLACGEIALGLGVTQAQGYAYGRPAPLATWLPSGRDDGVGAPGTG